MILENNFCHQQLDINPRYMLKIGSIFAIKRHFSHISSELYRLSFKMNRKIVLVVFFCIFHSVILIDLDYPMNSETGRIVGGVDTPRANVNFFCSVFDKSVEKREHKCGCAIVHTKWAVTSAV